MPLTELPNRHPPDLLANGRNWEWLRGQQLDKTDLDLTGLTGDVTVSAAGVTAIGTGKVTSTMILDGTVALGDLATATVDALTPWSIDIDPLLTKATATNWATIQTAATYAASKGGLESSGAQNAQVGWDIVLAAGTWTFSLLHVKNTNRGIYTVALDGTSAGTIDGYNGGGSVPDTVSTITGITVAATGKKRLTLTMATKNASSSSFFGSIQAVGLRRTA